MNMQTGSQQNLSNQMNLLNDFLVENNSCSQQEIGDKLIEKNILKEADLEVFLDCLKQKLPTSNDYKNFLRFLVNPAEEKRNKALSQISNWDIFQRILSSSECAPLFHHNLQTLPPGHFQREIKTLRKFCKKQYESTNYSNNKKLRQLKLIIDEFNKKRIPVIPLKGGFLAFTLYSEIGLRPMSDLDILVKPENIKAAQSVLRKIGFEQSHKTYFNDRYRYHDVYQRKASSGEHLTIELHWNLFIPLLPMHFSIEEIWDRAVRFSGKSLSCLTMSFEDNVIYLVAHFTNHCLYLDNILDEQDVFQALFKFQSKAKIKWLVDIYLLISENKKQLDWNKVIERSKAWNLTHKVVNVLTLINLIFDQVVPLKIINSLRENDDYSLSCQVSNWLFQLMFYPCKKSSHRFFRKILINKRKNLPYVFGPRIPDIFWYFFPNRNYFIQNEFNKLPLNFHRLIHFIKALFEMFILTINRACFIIKKA